MLSFCLLGWGLKEVFLHSPLKSFQGQALHSSMRGALTSFSSKCPVSACPLCDRQGCAVWSCRPFTAKGASSRELWNQPMLFSPSHVPRYVAESTWGNFLAVPTKTLSSAVCPWSWSAQRVGLYLICTKMLFGAVGLEQTLF